MPRFTALLVLILSSTDIVHSQVKDIKRASSSKSSEVSGGRSSGASGYAGDFFFQFMVSGVVEAQQHKLQRRHEVPSMVSLDLLLQGASQPSSYYIVNPRIRANWGLFSTDFRMNFIIEEEFEGVSMLHTNDWQILQLNLVTTREVTVRVGGGVIYEAFGERNDYPEWTAAAQYSPPTSRFGGVAEYRGSEARREVNGSMRYKIYERNKLHTYLTAGAVFQRHYSEINVWGFQGGIMLSIF